MYEDIFELVTIAARKKNPPLLWQRLGSPLQENL